VHIYSESRDNLIFFDPWVTRYSEVWGSVCMPLAHRSSASNIIQIAGTVF